MRIGTREREDAIRVLGEHFAEGRLFTEEYEHRAGLAADATVRADLAALFSDLPMPHPPCLAPPPPPPPLPVAPPPAPAGPARAPVEYQSDRNRLIAGLLQIVFPFGIGRFYTGHTGVAVAQLLTSILIVGVIWSFIDGIILLAQGGTDAYGRPLSY